VHEPDDSNQRLSAVVGRNTRPRPGVLIAEGKNRLKKSFFAGETMEAAGLGESCFVCNVLYGAGAVPGRGEGLEGGLEDFLPLPLGFGDPHAFAGVANLNGRPPVYIINSESDTLCASGELFAAQLEAAGVPRQDGKSSLELCTGTWTTLTLRQAGILSNGWSAGFPDPEDSAMNRIRDFQARRRRVHALKRALG
jgi:hypothetical protein